MVSTEANRFVRTLSKRVPLDLIFLKSLIVKHLLFLLRNRVICHPRPDVSVKNLGSLA